MTENKTADTTLHCKQHPNGCDPWDRHVYSMRTRADLRLEVERKARELGLPDTNAGITAALEAWTDWESQHASDIAGKRKTAREERRALADELRKARETVEKLEAEERARRQSPEPEAPRKRKAAPLVADGGDKAATAARHRSRIEEAEARPAAAKVVRFMEPPS